MKTSLNVRIATLLASICTSLTLVQLIATYAYPEAHAPVQSIIASLGR